MLFDEMYATWAEENKFLSDFQKRRIFDRARKIRSMDTLRSFFSYGERNKNQELYDLLGLSRDPQELAVWLQYASDDERENFFKTKDSDTLTRFLTSGARVDLGEKTATMLWDRDDSPLRLAILTRYRTYRGIPKAWSEWFRKNYPFTGAEFSSFRMSLDEVLRAVVKNEEVASSIFSSSRSLELRAKILHSMEPDSWGVNGKADILDETFQAKLKKPALTAKEKTLLVSHLKWRHQGVSNGNSSRSKFHEEKLMKLLKETSGKISQFSGDERSTLDSLITGYFGEEGVDVPLTPDEVLAALNKGELPEIAIEMAAERHSKEMWKKVVASERLTPQNAKTLLTLVKDRYSFSSSDYREVCREVVEDRGEEWRYQFARIVWQASGSWRSDWRRGESAAFQVGVNGLNSKRTEKLLEEIVTSSSDVEKLLNSGAFLSSNVLDHTKVEWVARSKELQKKVATEVSWRLGEDPAKWENFEKLADGFVGSFSELLTVAAHV